MSKKFSLTQADFVARFCRFTKPEEIPLTYKIGDTAYSGIPAAFNPAVTTAISERSDRIIHTTIKGTSPEGLTIRVEYEEYKDYPVTEWLAFFSNEGSADTPALSDVRFEATILNRTAGQGKPILYHSDGEGHGENGFNHFVTKLDHPVSLEPEGGLSCFGAFPYMRVICGGAAEAPTADDLAVNIAVGWPGHWIAQFEPYNGGVQFKAGLARLNAALHPGETLRSPRMTYMTTVGDETKSRNAWRRWYIAHILPKDHGERLKPMLAAHVFCANGKAEFTGADEGNMCGGFMDYVNQGMTPDIWWLDAGWYACDSWWRVGSWEIDRERFPNTLAPLGELCEKYGSKLLLWFEPERAFEGSILDKEQPERLTVWYNEDGTEHSGNRLYYLGDPDNLKWMTDHVDAIIKESHVGIYRQDCNFSPEPYWQILEKDDEARVGVPENLHVQGYLAYWDALVERNPGLLIDSCAGGGKRNDLETMRRAFPLHYTDWGYGNHPLKQRQHNLLFSWIPYFRAHNQSWDDGHGNYVKPNAYGIKYHPDEFAYHCAMTPAITAMTEHDAVKEEFDVCRKMNPIWREAAELMISGDYYPLTSCDNDSSLWYAMQFYDDKTGKGFIQMLRNIRCANDTMTVYPFAEEGATYTFTNRETGESFVKTAAELESGFTVTLPERTGAIYFMQKA